MEREAVSADGESSKRHYHSQALTRGLEAIRVVATTRGPSTLTSIHLATDIPKSTLVRLLAVLEEDDYLIKVDERPAYQLGHALLPIAVGYFEMASVADLLRPHLAALSAATGWTSNFGILDGSDVVHLCVEFPERPIYYTTTEGSSHPAYCTALGKAIMTELDSRAVDRALPAEPFPRLTAHTITTRKGMRAALKQARERGFAIDAEESDIGLRCIAVPVVGERGVLGALSVSGPSGEAGPEREQMLVEHLRRTRAAIRGITELPNALGVTGAASG